MNCINYKWPIEQSESLDELESIVERMLKQFEVEYFQVLYPDLSWDELGELLSEELEEDPSINTLTYWLETAEKQKMVLGEVTNLKFYGV